MEKSKSRTLTRSDFSCIFPLKGDYIVVVHSGSLRVRGSGLAATSILQSFHKIRAPTFASKLLSPMAISSRSNPTNFRPLSMIFFNEVYNLFNFKTSIDGRTGMRAKFRIQSVYIKTNIHICRQLMHNFIMISDARLPPSNSFSFMILVEIGDHPLFVIADIIEFFFAVVPDSHLDQSSDLGNILQCIVHDAGMTVVQNFHKLCAGRNGHQFAVFRIHRVSLQWPS